MSDLPFEKYAFPARRVIFSSYSGPRSGVADATRTLFAWVGTYFKDRKSDVTLCYAQRSSPENQGDPDALVDVECHLELDEYIASDVKLPEGLKIKQIPPEILLIATHRGPITDLRGAMRPWVEAMTKQFDIKPGYRQRIVVQGKSPTDPDWEVELQLVLQPTRASAP